MCFDNKPAPGPSRKREWSCLHQTQPHPIGTPDAVLPRLRPPRHLHTLVPRPLREETHRFEGRLVLAVPRPLPLRWQKFLELREGGLRGLFRKLGGNWFPHLLVFAQRNAFEVLSGRHLDERSRVVTVGVGGPFLVAAGG